MNASGDDGHYRKGAQQPQRDVGDVPVRVATGNVGGGKNCRLKNLVGFVLLGLDGVSNRASFSGNCRLETACINWGRRRSKILVKKRRLEITSTLCFDGVAAISNRGCRY